MRACQYRQCDIRTLTGLLTRSAILFVKLRLFEIDGYGIDFVRHGNSLVVAVVSLYDCSGGMLVMFK